MGVVENDRIDSAVRRGEIVDEAFDGVSDGRVGDKVREENAFDND